MDSKILALITTIAIISGQMMYQHNSLENQFESFKVKFGKVYETKVEHTYRLSVYNANMKEIATHNAKEGITYTKGENQFTDLTKQEFAAKYLMKTSPKKSSGVEISGEPTLGDINWVTKGGVQHIKNQGQCGSCWAFSTAAVAEGWKFVQTGTLGDFSEQQLTSCDDGNDGCDGGWPSSALDYYASAGICTEESYPYTSGDGDSGECQEDSCTMDSFTISGHNSISQSASSVKAANEKSPVSVCVDAENWSSYEGGIFDDCTDQTDHAVLLAGYSGDDYWLIKNSWGESWGESGYIRLAGGEDTCGVLTAAVVPQ